MTQFKAMVAAVLMCLSGCSMCSGIYDGFLWSCFSLSSSAMLLLLLVDGQFFRPWYLWLRSAVLSFSVLHWGVHLSCLLWCWVRFSVDRRSPLSCSLGVMACPLLLGGFISSLLEGTSACVLWGDSEFEADAESLLYVALSMQLDCLTADLFRYFCTWCLSQF